jgi:ADP-ribosylglycohydrolase
MAVAGRAALGSSVTTVASVLHVLREATSLATAMKYAVSIGGDTDTAAAIVGGVLGCRSENVDPEIPWLASVVLPESELIEAQRPDCMISDDHFVSSATVIRLARLYLYPCW